MSDTSPTLLHLNRPTKVGREAEYIAEVVANEDLGEYSKYLLKCETFLKDMMGCAHPLLVSSCTHALEIAAMLLDIKPGDEVIMPSFTFVSTGNAFALRGATLVFIDVRRDTLCMDETLLEAAITPKTRAIVPVHYAGIACAMDEIMAIARNHNIPVIEDAAHSIFASYKGRALGTMGAMGTLSFDIMKNICAGGQGGALVVNDAQYLARAEIMINKGTNRLAFQRGEESQYEWKDIGSFYAMSALNAAYLYANMEEAETIQSHRMMLWNNYHRAFKWLADAGHITLPFVPEACEHNAHIYFIRVKDRTQRDAFIAFMREQNVTVAFHFVPLHVSAGGKQYGGAGSALDVTVEAADTLVRLPVFYGFSLEEQRYVLEAVLRFWA